jgi:serine O-acetyltransferase
MVMIKLVLATLKYDWQRLQTVMGKPHPGDSLNLITSFLCVVLYRLASYCYANKFLKLARFFCLCNTYITGADISPRSQIGQGLVVPYPAGIAIDCEAGCDLTVMALSGIGLPYGDLMKSMPVLGNNVYLSSHSGVYGAVTIGDNVVLMPGCMVSEDVLNHSILASLPLRLRHK